MRRGALSTHAASCTPRRDTLVSLATVRLCASPHWRMHERGHAARSKTFVSHAGEPAVCPQLHSSRDVNGNKQWALRSWAD